MLSLDPVSGVRRSGTAFGRTRTFLNNRFVYLVVSQRAGGLSIGVNLNPDRVCNFKCVYCEVDHSRFARDWKVDIAVMRGELEAMLLAAKEGRIATLPEFTHLPPELLELKEVAVSGDGEPTLSPQFNEAMAELVGVRAQAVVPFFKIVLITNTAGLLKPDVREALRYLSTRDEIWAKLEAGTQAYMDRINVPDIKLRDVMSNILKVARKRPVVIQSLFALVRGEGPSDEEIYQYVCRLKELKERGAQIASVQIYSAHRPAYDPECSHLPLKVLSGIARNVRQGTGLKAEVF